VLLIPKRQDHQDPEEAQEAQETRMTARIPPLEAPYDPDAAGILRRMMPPGAEPVALFRMLARNLPLAHAMHDWGAYELGRHPGLTLRDREIVIDRTTARCGCEYEWGVHVAHFAARAALTPEQIRSLTHGTSADPCWSEPRDRLLLDLVDALHADADVPDLLWERLTAHFTREQLLDLITLCGWYHAIAFLARATRLPPEPGTPRFGDCADQA
jgi:alkylhydroperoxidase family enzyme